MIKIYVEEAKAFDELSILEIKAANGGSKELVEIYKDWIKTAIGIELFERVYDSLEYLDLFAANLETFILVDKAKKDEVKASIVDASNTKRWENKKALQFKFFNVKLQEEKM